MISCLFWYQIKNVCISEKWSLLCYISKGVGGWWLNMSFLSTNCSYLWNYWKFHHIINLCLWTHGWTSMWCISTTRSRVFLRDADARGLRIKRKRGQGKCGYTLGILSNMMDSMALKPTKQTHQDSKNTLLVLPAFLSVPQYLPQAVYPGPLFHSSVTLASALPRIFTLCFLSPRCLSGHQEAGSEFCLCFSVCWRIRCTRVTLAKPLVFKFSFMFTPCIIPLFHNNCRPTACRVLCFPSPYCHLTLSSV